MAQHRIVQHYVLTPLPDPTAVMLWQRTLCEALGLRGRILVAPHGINATVGGEVGAVKHYVRATRSHPGFRGLVPAWSDGRAEDFPRLSVKVRDELVPFGAADELEVDERGVVGGGARLAPAELDELVARSGDEGLWEGSLYVFDRRMHAEFSPDAVPIGRCERCTEPANRFVDCADASCRALVLACPACGAGHPGLICPAGCAAPRRAHDDVVSGPADLVPVPADLVPAQEH